MPRTKRPTKKQEKIAEHDDLNKKLSQIVKEEKKAIESKVQMLYREVDMAVKIITGSFSAETLQRTIGDLKNELNLKEVGNTKATNIVRPASQDDGYMTQNSSQSSDGRSVRRMLAPPSSAARAATTTRRSRSADASTRKQTHLAVPGSMPRGTQRRRSRSVYKTPMYKTAPNYPPITPKVAPDMPMTLLRQPRQGEMVVSMSGSPVMVPTYRTMQPDEKANCNILLQDGTMLSLQPKHLRKSNTYIPFSLMDSNVLGQLRTLKDNLETVVKMGEMASK